MQHVDIVDPYIHEPKDVSTATAGQVYVADGAGSGVWTSPSYGELKVIENASSFTPVAADIAQYKQLTNANGVPWVSGEYSNITLNTDSITFLTAGVYRIDFWSVVETAAIDGTEIGFKFALDGTLDTRVLKIQKNSTGTDYLPCSAFSYVSVTANQVLTLWASSSATTTLKVINAGLSVQKLK